jgi:hypothetical protein
LAIFEGGPHLAEGPIGQEHRNDLRRRDNFTRAVSDCHIESNVDGLTTLTEIHDFAGFLWWRRRHRRIRRLGRADAWRRYLSEQYGLLTPKDGQAKSECCYMNADLHRYLLNHL